MIAMSNQLTFFSSDIQPVSQLAIAINVENLYIIDVYVFMDI